MIFGGISEKEDIFVFWEEVAIVFLKGGMRGKMGGGGERRYFWVSKDPQGAIFTAEVGILVRGDNR